MTPAWAWFIPTANTSGTMSARVRNKIKPECSSHGRGWQFPRSERPNRLNRTHQNPHRKGIPPGLPPEPEASVQQTPRSGHQEKPFSRLERRKLAPTEPESLWVEAIKKGRFVLSCQSRVLARSVGFPPGKPRVLCCFGDFMCPGRATLC